MPASVGFIGLGRMGLPMAHKLLEAGYRLSVFNRTTARADGVCAQGATRTATPRAVAKQHDIILSIVADDAALRAIALGDSGVLAGLTPGKIHVDMSTVSPEVSRELDHRYRAKGAHFVAAPVFGRPEAAAAATLWICPAGPPEAIERCRPVFESLGQGVIVVGTEPHLASCLKLVGNFFVVAAIETLSEALTLAEKSGLKSETVLALVKALLPVPLFEGYGTRMARNEFSPPGFALRLGIKDVDLMRRLADQTESPLPLADVVHHNLLAAHARGRGDLDWGALITVIRELAGLEPGDSSSSESG